MGFESFVGLRYLMAKRSRNVLSVITIISITGVAVGVTALIVVLSVMGGFEGDLREKIIGAKAHIVVKGKSGAYLTDYTEIAERVREVPGVTGASPFLEGEVMVNSVSNLQGVILRGVDPDTVNDVTELDQNMTRGGLQYLDKPDSLPPNRAPGQSDWDRVFSEPINQSFKIQSDLSDGPIPIDREDEMKSVGARASITFVGSDHGNFVSRIDETDVHPNIDDDEDETPATDPEDEEGSGDGGDSDPDGDAADPPIDNDADTTIPSVDDIDDIDDSRPPSMGRTMGRIPVDPVDTAGGDDDDDDFGADADTWVDGGPSDADRNDDVWVDDSDPNVSTIGPKRSRRPMGPIPGTTVERRVGGLIVGAELQTNLAVYVGSEVNVMSPMGDLGPSGSIPKSRPFKVVGVFYTGMYEFDTKYTYMTLADAQTFLNVSDKVTGVEIRIEDMDKSGEVKVAIEQALGDQYGELEVKDWRELNTNLFSALMLEKIAMFVILGFIILVASFSIVCLLIMIVIEKGREIAILKSMGASNQSVVSIFVLLGGIIGVIGTAMGAAIGLALCWVISGWGIELPADVYYLSQVPVEVRPVEVLMICGSAILISLLATILPSILAAILDPVEGLRYD